MITPLSGHLRSPYQFRSACHFRIPYHFRIPCHPRFPCHPRAGGDPEQRQKWIAAFAGMTVKQGGV